MTEECRTFFFVASLSNEYLASTSVETRPGTIWRISRPNSTSCTRLNISFRSRRGLVPRGRPRTEDRRGPSQYSRGGQWCAQAGTRGHCRVNRTFSSQYNRSPGVRDERKRDPTDPPFSLPYLTATSIKRAYSGCLTAARIKEGLVVESWGVYALRLSSRARKRVDDETRVSL